MPAHKQALILNSALFVQVFHLVALQFMIGLNTQGSDQAIQNVIVLISASAELFAIAVEKLAEISGVAHLGQNKVTIVVFPVAGRTVSDLAVVRSQAQFHIHPLSFGGLAIAFLQGVFDDLGFFRGEIWY